MDDALGTDLNQKREWVQAILGGPAAMSNFDYASVLTETMLLGNIAVRTGQAIDYDGASGKVTNSKEADYHVRGDYRKGWEI
jgi:hypothetical protein